MAFSPDSGCLVTGIPDGCLMLWDARSGQALRTVRGHPGGILSVASRSDGRLVACGDGNGEVKVWDTATWQEALNLPGHTVPVMDLAFSPEGGRLASAAALLPNTGEVRICDITSGQEVFFAKDQPVYSVAFSPDCRYLAYGCLVREGRPGEVKVLDAASGQERLTLVCPQFLEEATARFSPDSRFLVTPCADGAVRFWDATTGEETRTFRGHTGSVLALAFSPDGKRLATTGHDRTLKLWDLETGQAVLTIRRAKGPAWFRVVFSADGHRLAASSLDDTAWIWDATPLDPSPSVRKK
jgi:WD40 repeat protein